MSKAINNLMFRPRLFDQFPNVIAAMSLRDPGRPDGNSMLPRGTTEEIATANRRALVTALGFDDQHVAIPKLQHADAVIEVGLDYQGDWPRADAVVTNQRGWLIGVGVADCVAVLLYDPVKQVLGAVHSGWRGTVAEVTPKTLHTLASQYKSQPQDTYAWLSPAPSRFEYEVGHEVSEQFPERYRAPKAEDKDWLDNRLAVYDQLLAAGVPAAHIAVDPRSTMLDPQLHSARRDGEHSGRMLMAIGLTA